MTMQADSCHLAAVRVCSLLLVASTGSIVQWMLCRFQAQTAPWALPWKPSLSLRFSSRSEEEAAGRAPASMPVDSTLQACC